MKKLLLTLMIVIMFKFVSLHASVLSSTPAERMNNHTEINPWLCGTVDRIDKTLTDAGKSGFTHPWEYFNEWAGRASLADNYIQKQKRYKGYKFFIFEWVTTWEITYAPEAALYDGAYVGQQEQLKSFIPLKLCLFNITWISLTAFGIYKFIKAK